MCALPTVVLNDLLFQLHDIDRTLECQVEEVISCGSLTESHLNLIYSRYLHFHPPVLRQIDLRPWLFILHFKDFVYLIIFVHNINLLLFIQHVL